MPKTKVNGAAIRVIRERSDLSVSDVVTAMGAEGIDIHADHLRNIELGYRQPSPKVLGALARALRVPKVAILAAVSDEQASA
jgi:transcriptional regulator with XRE-family HTH domain